ncbi:MAG: PAS domain S-box protein [candidate division Zixibacteria bacterium]|nr:PAS domain S-box protein [candidate division Zixibacteria bacterium]
MKDKAKNRDSNLDQVMSNLPDIVYSLNPKGEFISVSSAIEKILGYKPAELIGKSVFDLIDPEEKEMRIRRYKKDIEDLYTGSIRFISRMISKSGETKQLETSRKMVVENGRVVRSDGIARDITSEFALRQQFQHRTDELEQQTRELEQKTLELARANIDLLAMREELEKNRREQDSQFEELTKSREGLEAILNSSPSAIIMVNSYGKIATANGRVEDFFHIKRDSIIGKQFQEFSQSIQHCFTDKNQFHKELQSIWKNPAAPKFERLFKHTKFKGALNICKNEASERFILIDSLPVLNNNGQELGKVWIFDDITEIRDLVNSLETTNRELKEMQAQLIQSEKMASLGLLVAGIAHEINTPIGAVNSMHDTSVRAIAKLKDLVADLNLDEAGQIRAAKVFEAIDSSNKVIKSGTERVGGIVRRLRSFARLDEADLQTVDIHEGLEDTLALLNHQIKNRIEVIKNYGQLQKISCYPGKLNQVFLNLLNNAHQAIAGKGTISITTSSDESKVYIEIADSGSGIPKENLSQIFDPGFTTKGVGVGTGLGLSICYQIISEHKGEIKVESREGQGTTFTIVLPRNLDKIVGKQPER